jgi:hypothetical protein
MIPPQTTLVIQFGDGADSAAFAVAEFDEVLNTSPNGESKSSWLIGESINFWVQHDPSLRVASILPTGAAGEVISHGIARRKRDQELSWPDVETAVELSHIPASAPALTWYGLPGTGMQLDGRSLRITGGAPCTCDAVIPIDVHLFRFIPPVLELATAEDKYRVILYITMEAA